MTVLSPLFSSVNMDNPPRSCSRVLNIDDHNEVFIACRELKAEWKEIGSGSLEAIYADEKKSVRCMLEMIAVWLKRDSDKQPYPTWRGLCLAIASVDRIAAERISEEHPCHCSYCAGMIQSHVDLSPVPLPSKEQKLSNYVVYSISENYQSRFEKQRRELNILFANVKETLVRNNITLDRLKFFLSLHLELRHDCKAAQSLEDAMMAVCDRTSLINTKYIDDVARMFKLQDTTDLIKRFHDSINEFCKTFPTKHLYGQDFMQHSRKQLQESEEVEFVLEWDGHKTTLNDIQILLRKAFHDKARHVMVKVVNERNSIIVICYAPPQLHGDLAILVKHNEVYLRNEKVLSVTIRGFAILEREKESKLNTQGCMKDRVSNNLSICNEGITATTISHIDLPHDILKPHIPHLLGLIANPDKLANQLSSYGLISEKIKDDMLNEPSLSRFKKASRLLNEVQHVLELSSEPKMLKSFCYSLKEQDDPALNAVADTMLNQLDISLTKDGDSLSLASIEEPKLPKGHYRISEYYQALFQAKRGELLILIANVKNVIKDNKISLEEFTFLLRLHPELEDAARAAKSLEDAIMIVRDYTSLTNTSYLQTVAKNFKLQDAIDLIKEFDESIDTFCKRIPTEHSYGQDFMEHSHKHLQESEEVEFVLEWEGDETTLNDIQSLLRNAFHDKARHVIVKVVNPRNSINVICYAPPHLHEELTILVKHNEAYLRNRKVLSVTIGGEIILHKPSENLENEEYIQILEKAKKEGFVSVKWSNFSLSGSSGVGKTSLLNLLLERKPFDVHHSTPVAKAPEIYLVSKDEQDDYYDEGMDTNESIDGADGRVTEIERHVIMSDGECVWISADPETVKIQFLQSLKYCVRTRSDATMPSELKQSINDQEKSTDGLKSELPLLSQVTPMQKPQESLTSDPSTSLQFFSEGEESDEELIHVSRVKKPQKSAPRDSSSLTKEFLRLLSEVKESDKLYKTHWMYGLDSGGQAAFLDIAPALLRYHSLNMVLFRLDEKLDDDVNFFYSVHGRKVGEGEKRQMSTMQLTKSIFRYKSRLRPPSLKGVENVHHHGKPQFLVIGTYYDEYKMLQDSNQLRESLDEKNERLHGELNNYEDVRHDYTEDKDIIFPINTLGRSKNERQIAERIRRIACQAYITAEVPARWFFFQLELTSKTKDRKVISFDECLEIGKSLRMQHMEVKAALWYFHNLTIFLYFPDILRNVVFLDPQFLFDKLSEIIAVSYGDVRFDDATIQNLREKGIFKRKLMDTMEFPEDVFSTSDFFKLMEGLLIISKIPNDTRYFIPCVLDIIDQPFEDVSNNDVEPLLLTWKNEVIPNGLFTSLVVLLLGLETQIHFQLGNGSYRNKIVLECKSLEGIMHLVDGVECLGIHYNGPKHNCFMIRQIIRKGMASIFDKFSWNITLASVQEVFQCKICNNPSFHFCRLNLELVTLTCDETGVCCDADKIRHLSWLREKDTSRTVQQFSVPSNPTDTDRSTVDTKQVIQCIKEVMQTYHPDLSELFEGLLKTVSSEMYAAGLIPHAVEKNPTFDAIMSSFLSGFAFKKNLEDVEKYCVKFFNVFYKIGAQFVDAADIIKHTIQDIVRDKLTVQLNM